MASMHKVRRKDGTAGYQVRWREGDRNRSKNHDRRGDALDHIGRLRERERLGAHNESPACAGCHKITDPIGLALENYDAVGTYRTHENGAMIDPSGKFVRELGQDVYGFNAAIGLRIDPQDNVWTVDAGANQVVKFDTEGKVALVLGRKPETMAVRPP